MFFNLCKSIGHDECHCRSYQLMMDRTPMYRMQVETHRQKDEGATMARGGFHAKEEERRRS